VVWSGVASVSAAVSEQYQRPQPVRRQASNCRPRPGCVVRRRAISALGCISGEADMLLPSVHNTFRSSTHGRDVTARLVIALVLSRVNYCNAGIHLGPSDTGCRNSGSIYTRRLVAWQRRRAADTSTNRRCHWRLKLSNSSRS